MIRSLGMMSGTSIDGSVSVAIIETDGVDSVKRISTAEYCYEDHSGLRAVHHFMKAAELAYRESRGDHQVAANIFSRVLRGYIEKTFQLEAPLVEGKLDQLVKAFDGSACEIGLLDVVQRSTEVHIEAARSTLQSSGFQTNDIQYIGYHGQTLYHDPHFNKITIQVGDPQALADELQIPVVFDFRSEDLKHGGQGAPLAPVYHRALVRSAGHSSAAILNLGGTANVTVVSAESEQMLGFDTGPANGLIDRYVKERAIIAFDKDSLLAERGTVSNQALQALIERSVILKDGRNYLHLQPPKSLDIRDYTFDLPEFQVLSLEDGCATLNAFSAECVALGVSWIEKAGFEVPSKWILCGGGTFSPHLRTQIFQRLKCRIGERFELLSAENIGWSAQGMEAELIAYLAVRSVKKLPLTFPGTTGVAGPLNGGREFKPKACLEKVGL